MLCCCNSGSSVYEAILLELYLQFPYLLAWVSDPHSLTADTRASNTQTQVLPMYAGLRLNIEGFEEIWVKQL